MYVRLFVYCLLYECHLLLATTIASSCFRFCWQTAESPKQDKEMVTGYGWNTIAMWRLFVYMHIIVWVVKYEVNYQNSLRRFPKGSVSGYCIILHWYTWSQSCEDCLRLWFYTILHHNVEKKRNIYPVAEKNSVFFLSSYLPCFFFLFFFFFFFWRIINKREQKFYLPYFFQEFSNQ